VSEDFPNIEVAYWNGASWVDITDFIYRFEVRDAGIKKIPQASIVLHNVNGDFTKSAGSHSLSLFDEVRIRADVRGSWDTIFQGNIYAFDPDEYIRGESSPSSILTLIARSKYGQKLLRETITYPYFDRGWTCREAIQDFLANPDSGSSTGITLNDDSGIITTYTFPKNLSKSPLLKGIQAVCEELGYVGYIDDATGTLYLRRYRTVPTLTAVSPSIHYDLSSGLTLCRPKKDIEEIKNYIFIWGGSDVGFPPVDIWCEKGMAKYSPAAWTAGHANITLSDDNVIYVGDNYSIKGEAMGGTVANNGYIQLNISNTGYFQPQSPSDDDMNFNDDRFDIIGFHYRYTGFLANWEFCLKLIDRNGERVRRETTVGAPGIPQDTWIDFHSDGSDPAYAGWYPIDTASHAGSWTLETAGPFDWNHVQYMQFGPWDGGATDWAGWAANAVIWIDRLMVEGVGWSIDPMLYPLHNPAHSDSTSIANYGRTVYHHVDENIICFENAYYEGERFLLENKDPYSRIEITKGAKTWIHPSQYLQVSIPTWDINNANYRIEEVIHRYNAESKLLRTSVNLVAYSSEVSVTKLQAESFGSLWSPPSLV